MNEQLTPQLYDQAEEAQNSVPTSRELIDGWASAEAGGDSERSDVYKKALEGHLEAMVEDGMISPDSLNDHVDAIHTAQEKKVSELKAAANESKKTKIELDNEKLPEDEFDGAYSSLGNKHTFLKTADGKNRQVSRAVALAKAENMNAENGLEDEPAAERLNQLNNELNKAGERGVSKEKFAEIADALWKTARRQARQTGSTELMRAVKEHIIRSDDERLKNIKAPDMGWDAPKAENKVGVKELMEKAPSLDFHPGADRPRAITQDERKQFDNDLSGGNAPDTSGSSRFDAPKAENRKSDFMAMTEGLQVDPINKVSGKLEDAFNNWRKDNQEAREQMFAGDREERISKVVEARNAGQAQLADYEEAVLVQMIENYAAYNNLTDEETDALLSSAQQDIAIRMGDSIVTELPDEESENDPSPEAQKRGLAARLKRAGYMLASLPYRIRTREHNEGGPMSRKAKAAIAVGGLATVVGVAYVAHRSGVFDHDAIVGSTSKPSGSANSENLDQAAELLNGRSNNPNTGNLDQAADLLSARQPEGPSQEAIDQVNEAISNRTNEIYNTPGSTLWSKANSLYGDQATPQLIEAVDGLKAKGVNIDWTENPMTSRNAAIVYNGSQSSEATADAWRQISDFLAHEEMERFFENAKKDK